MAKTHLLVAIFVVASLGASGGTRRPPGERIPTITTLLDLPQLPASNIGLSETQKSEVVQTLVNLKVSTYPVASSRGYPHQFEAIRLGRRCR